MPDTQHKIDAARGWSGWQKRFAWRPITLTCGTRIFWKPYYYKTFKGAFGVSHTVRRLSTELKA